MITTAAVCVYLYRRHHMGLANEARRLRSVFAVLIGFVAGFITFSPHSPLSLSVSQHLAESAPRVISALRIRAASHASDEETVASIEQTDQMEIPNTFDKTAEELKNLDDSSEHTAQLTATKKWPRIFCMINTMPSHRSRVDTVNNTWVQHCDGHIFTTTRINESVDPTDEFWTFKFGNSSYGADNHIWLWDRLRAAMRKMYYEKAKDYDFFLKCDDDTFAVIENLKEYLKDVDPDSPQYLAALLHYTDKGRPKGFIYPSGGSGYVLSREALRRFVHVIELNNGDLCRNDTYLHEDTEVGWCLLNANVTTISSVDEEGRHKMIPIDLLDILHDSKADSHSDRGWARQTLTRRLPAGRNCCSTHLITAHYISEPLMATYYYLVYGLKVASL